MSVKNVLASLNFHDSTLVAVSLFFPGSSQRSCALELDYYDWEGNTSRRSADPKANWVSRRLKLTFGFLAHIEFSAPDLVNRAQDLDQAEVGYRLSEFQERHLAFKQQFPRGRYPLFDDGSEVVSLRLSTQNNDENSSGFLWVVGSTVELEWLSGSQSTGQTHFSLSDA